jgi:formylglycine-generating enzyme required for sulfatase activity
MKLVTRVLLGHGIALVLVANSAVAGEYVNNIGMEFIQVSAGTFFMGSQDSEQGSSKEKPRHSVHISKPFYLAKYEVTQKQWMAVMGNVNPSNFLSPDRPVDEVSWNDVQVFIQKLNGLEKTGTYRLPTEAEWEYAARAGSETAFCYGDDMEGAKLSGYAWFEQNAGKQSHPVGILSPNAWGFYDMHGNVTEWVQDYYDRNYYSDSPEKDPQGPEAGRKRVVRGGSWINQPYSCRSAARGYYSEDYTDSDFGFRIVKVIE